MPIFKQRKKTEKDFRMLAGSTVAHTKAIRNLKDKVEWFNTPGVPSNALGKNGDRAIDEAGVIYKKQGGKWS